MKFWSAASFGSAAGLVLLHAAVFLRLHSPARDPNGYDLMLLFFFGVPLAVAVTVVSALALRATRLKRFRIPLAIGALPLAGWPAVLLLEYFQLIP